MAPFVPVELFALAFLPEILQKEVAMLLGNSSPPCGSLSWARTMSLPTETYLAFTPSAYLMLGLSLPGEVSQAEAQGKDRERHGPGEAR